MSISALPFAEHQLYTDRNKVEYEGAILYYRTGDSCIQIGDTIPFSLGESDWTEITLFEYADGTKLIMEYKIERTQISAVAYQYALTFKARVDNKNGVNLIPAIAEHTVFENWSPSEPGFESPPFSDMYYLPAVVNYQSPLTPAGGTTATGQPAETLYLWGGIYWRKPRVPVGGYVAFIGDHDVNTFGNSYGGWNFAYFVVNDNGYNDYFDLVDPDDEWHKTGTVPTQPDPSEPGGGDRPDDDDGVPVDFPTTPTVSVINTGFITLYNPDAALLRNLATVLWGNDFEQSIKKILNDPFDGVIGLSLIPFSPTVSGNLPCHIGNFDTEVSMPLVSAQYYTLDCGSITVSENWKNALDYNATNIEIFVPFVGFRPLNIQDCMGKVLHLKYNIDVFTGSGIAILKCGNKCLYEWACNIAYNIPLTGSNKAALYTGLMNIALSGWQGALMGGAGGALFGAASSALNVATSPHSNVQRSGAIVSNTGVLGEFTPYIIIHRPKQSLAQNFKSYKGYMSNITMTLGTCRGYTEVDHINLQNIPNATQDEMDEIKSLLKSGVIF